MQANYIVTYTQSDSDKSTYDLFGDENNPKLDSTLSNTFENDYVTQRPGVGLMIRGEKMFFRLGVSYQNAQLYSAQLFPTLGSTTQSFNSVLPMAFVRYNISKEKNLRLIYRSQTDAPSISQLQNVVDNSNPLSISVGNPSLDQSSTQRFIGRYSSSNPVKGTNFFGFVTLQQTQDYITTSSYTARKDTIIGDYLINTGTQIAQPVNLDGYWNVRSLVNYGVPVGLIKSNANFSFGANYARIPGLINDQSNWSNTVDLNGSLSIGSNISENVDFTLSYSANFNQVINTLQPDLNNNYIYQTAGAKVNYIFLESFVFRSDVIFNKYSGLTEAFNDEFTLWNMSLGKKIFNKQQGEVKVSVFDLLNQNRSISRTNTENSIDEVRTETLTQYFMATFTYTIRNFKTS